MTGEAELHLPVFMEADPSLVNVFGMEMVLLPDSAGGFQASIHAAVPGQSEDRPEQTFLEAVHRGFVQMVASDPASHRTLMTLFDANHDGALTADDFPAGSLDGVDRLLVHSHVSATPDDQWPTEFPYVSPELIAQLAVGGCRLIGLDSPSFDALTSTQLPGHHALYRHGLVNLECLQLNGVPDGDYELIALPLKLGGVCGSPVRAILRTL